MTDREIELINEMRDNCIKGNYYYDINRKEKFIVLSKCLLLNDVVYKLNNTLDELKTKIEQTEYEINDIINTYKLELEKRIDKND